MGKNQQMLKDEKPNSDFPAWYWEYGLHDAKILSVNELELPADWKHQNPHCNCLEFSLDSYGAYTKLKKISLFNYTVKTESKINMLEKTWWMGDELTALPDNRFLLEIETVDIKGNRDIFTVSFEDASVE